MKENMKLWLLTRTDRNSSCDAIGIYSTFKASEAALKAFGATEEQIKKTLYGGFDKSDFNNDGYAYSKTCLVVDEIANTFKLSSREDKIDDITFNQLLAAINRNSEQYKFKVEKMGTYFFLLEDNEIKFCSGASRDDMYIYLMGLWLGFTYSEPMPRFK